MMLVLWWEGHGRQLLKLGPKKDAVTTIEELRQDLNVWC